MRNFWCVIGYFFLLLTNFEPGDVVLWLSGCVCIVGVSYNHSVRRPCEEALTAWLSCVLCAGQPTCVSEQLWASQDPTALQWEGALTLRRLRLVGNLSEQEK